MIESKFTKIKKRDGRIVDWDQSKITSAIFKSLVATGENESLAQSFSDKVVLILNERFAGKIPEVEQIQVIIEEVLQKEGLEGVSRAYRTYRQKRTEIREAKWWLLNYSVKTRLNHNALTVLESRYLNKSEAGKIIETPQELFKRVAQNIASAEKLYRPGLTDEERFQVEEKFYHMMASLDFLPNSPTLMNAGNALQQLSACFVLPVPDSMEGIFEAIKETALIHQSGGGTGYSFSRLRPEGDIVKSTQGVASGPLSFMNVFDAATQTIKQGGKRRGAMMGMLRVDHPDILKFITSKAEEGILSNFNISVAITDEFMEKARKGEDYDLINPRTGLVWGKMNAKKVFDLITQYAWQTGDPGVIFIDKINKDNPTPRLGDIESTNPCVSSDTWVMTSEGPRQVKELIGKKTEVIVNGKKWSNSGNGFFETGIKRLFKLETQEGFELSLTGNHQIMTAGTINRNNINPVWKKTDDLLVGDKIIFHSHQELEWGGKYGKEEGYLIGAIIGDGYIGKDKIVLSSWNKDRGSESVRRIIEFYANSLPHRSDFHGWQFYRGRGEYRLSLSYLKEIMKELRITGNKEITPELEASSSDFYKGFLGGFFDTDGSVQGSQTKGVSIRLAQSNLQALKAVQRMLLRLGIYSRIYSNRRNAGTSKLPNGKGGYKFYETKSQHELMISSENIGIFYKKIGFMNSNKTDKIEKSLKRYRRRLNRERFVAIVKKITPIGIEKVYDIMVPGINAFDANGFYVHNCGEQPLLPHESCNLGSINLAKMLKETNDGKFEIDWGKFKKTVHTAVHFLNNVIDVNRYPLPAIEEMTKGNRKIGLGVMGFADMLIMLGIPYNSDEALQTAEKTMKFIQDESKVASAKLAQECGPFPNFRGSIYDKEGLPKLRNATTTTIAPTGTIGIIAGCSSGIEPLFALAFTRKHVLGGQELTEVNPIFEEIAKKRGFYSKELIEKISGEPSIKDFEEIPKDVRRIFVTAFDITFEDHVKIQAAFQKYIDNSVSKTINFPYEASVEDVRKAYFLAFDLGCKGITIFRTGSRQQQVLNIKPKAQETQTAILAAEKIPEHEVSPELRDPSPYIPDLPPGACPTCNV
ncbi:MAG: ribonucleoside reductase class II [Candidatus Nealsonbacteria bacterium]|nr:ribonucleoside reductase class II [Candidatus Nealsonbacteria bacterium]